MPTRTKRLVVMHVLDDGDRRVRLASLQYEREGRSQYQTVRQIIDAIPGSPFEVTSTYDTKYKGVMIVVQQEGVMACNVTVASRSATCVGLRLPSGHFVEIYHDWPKMR